MLIFTIRNLREYKNITLNDLSQKTNISSSYLSKLENNKIANCNTKILESISNALEVNIKDLFYSKFDIDALKEKLNESIDKCGINSKETLELSQLIDLIINVINNENK